MAVFLGVLTFAVVGVVGVAAPSSARASSTEQSILMDDYAFIYSTPSQMLANLEQIKALGVTTVKVSMVWSLVAPDPQSTTEPSFDATDPSAYPSGAWTRYDDLVEAADALGLRVYFQLTAPAPLWATSDDADVTGSEKVWSHFVNPIDFGEFAEAVGERYSGSYPISNDGSALMDSRLSATPATTLPAVNMWGIWNEPNEPQWLSPQTAVTPSGTTILAAPILERAMTDAGYAGLAASGHANDTILIGETSSFGVTHTIPFLLAMYCLNSKYQPLTGTAAANERCPTSGSRQSFVAANPGLFHASGYADHAYSFNNSPATYLASWALTLANLGPLEKTLDKIDSAYGQPTGLPIYNTEWGYKSDPPNPLVLTSLSEQADWLDQGYYMSYHMPRLKSMAQELLYDQPPQADTLPGALGYWATFDTGLEFEDGQAKPSLAAYRLPIWVPHAVTGSHVALWAQIRPAAVGQNNSVLLEYEAPGSSTWIVATTLRTRNADGFISTSVSLPQPGSIRLAWTDRTTPGEYYSRVVQIH